MSEKITDYTYEEKQRALDEAWEEMNPKVETDAERLARIKSEWFDGFMIANSNFNWLIEQAERTQELEISRPHHINRVLRDNERFSKENKRLREVLSFYANHENYEVNVVDQWGPEINIMMDGGTNADKTLEELK